MKDTCKGCQREDAWEGKGQMARYQYHQSILKQNYYQCHLTRHQIIVMQAPDDDAAASIFTHDTEICKNSQN